MIEMNLWEVRGSEGSFEEVREGKERGDMW